MGLWYPVRRFIKPKSPSKAGITRSDFMKYASAVDKYGYRIPELIADFTSVTPKAKAREKCLYGKHRTTGHVVYSDDVVRMVRDWCRLAPRLEVAKALGLKPRWVTDICDGVIRSSVKDYD